MGQYFLAVLLAEKGTVEGGEFVRTSLDPLKYGCGARITEHARVGNTFMSAVENLLCPDGIFYKTRVVWAGDFDVERNTRGEAICGSGGNKLGSEITSGALEAKNIHKLALQKPHFDWAEPLRRPTGEIGIKKGGRQGSEGGGVNAGRGGDEKNAAGKRENQLEKKEDNWSVRRTSNAFYPYLWCVPPVYVVNHTKHTYVSTDGQRFHPLAILTAEGNGKSTTDYFGTNADRAGSWARDVISVEWFPPPPQYSRDQVFFT